MRDGPAPTVSVIVVVYNGREHLSECLEALLNDRAAPSFEVWVVDNASTDGSADLAGRFPQVHLLRNSTNRGYAGGVNTALPHARGEFIAVLNPDCLVEPGWLTPLVAFLNAHANAGAVNPLLLLHGMDRINAAGQDVHITGLGFNRWLWQARARAGSAPMPISGLQGGAFVVRREALARMDGWDESGFLYHEDVQLSWLLQLMGYDLFCIPQSIVWHKYHLTMYPEKLFLLERNRWAMLMTHLRPATWLALAPFLLFTECLMWSYCLLRGPAFQKAKLASYQWVAAQTKALRERQRAVEALRRRSDWEVLRRLRWNYNWDQFFSLGRERGRSQREPKGGLPVKIKDEG